MTDEEMQQRMEFIIEQQARFSVNMDLLAEAQKRTEETVANLARMQTHMNEVVAVMAEAQERTDRKLSETDDRLNTLINVVERHVSEGHNGKSKG
jgi:hypothetical protein